MMPAPLRVLMVCTGNVCRSPAAEALLREGLGADSGIEVVSAGTWAPPAAPVSEPVARLLRGSGIDPSLHRSRQLTEQEVRQAHLILGMTREHRAWAVSRVPAALRRSFTLLEFARIARAVPSETLGGRTASTADRLAALIAAAPRHRRAHAEPDDIEDPIGRDDAVNAEVYGIIAAAVDSLVEAIRPGRADPGA